MREFVVRPAVSYQSESFQSESKPDTGFKKARF